MERFRFQIKRERTGLYPDRSPARPLTRLGFWKCCAGIACAGFLSVGGPDRSGAADLDGWTSEYWGTASLEGRLFADKPLYPGQRRNDFGLTLKPTLYFEGPEGDSFTFTPYLRVDGSDSERTHGDIREAYYLTFGWLDDIEWELRVGIDQVFWGTAESNHLVNIVNQTDLVDHPGGEEKLGQPMVHGTLSGDWGTVNLLVLPYHRPRTFPGKSGRLRPALPVRTDGNSIVYEHRSKERHVDFAARYGNSVGALDFGISAFKGTSREPLVVLYCSNGIPAAPGCTGSHVPAYFAQHYNIIEQVGLDLQLTLDAFLGKAEVISRKGFAETGANKSTHNAFVIGGEYAIYGVFESDADLTLLAEWSRDDRRAAATTALQNDVFLAARYALNDVDDTSMTAAIVGDLDYDTRTLNLEFSRRLSDTMSINLEAFKFLKRDSRDAPTWQVRGDDYLAFNLSYGF